jgi:hypothetical protein
LIIRVNAVKILQRCSLVRRTRSIVLETAKQEPLAGKRAGLGRKLVAARMKLETVDPAIPRTRLD